MRRLVSAPVREEGVPRATAALKAPIAAPRAHEEGTGGQP